MTISSTDLHLHNIEAFSCLRGLFANGFDGLALSSEIGVEPGVGWGGGDHISIGTGSFNEVVGQRSRPTKQCAPKSEERTLVVWSDKHQTIAGKP